jgi:hypothetical protein
MMATRNTFVDAKIQHRPDERWFVTGEPSKGILTLKVCVSLRTAEGLSRIVRGLLVESAENASRFLGSWRTVSIQEDVLERDTAVERSWGPGKSVCQSGCCYVEHEQTIPSRSMMTPSDSVSRTRKDSNFSSSAATVGREPRAGSLGALSA